MRKLSGHLQKQGGFPDTRISTNQNQTARHDSTTQHTVELIHFRLGPIDINRSDLSKLHGPSLFTCQGNTGMLDFCSLYFLNKRRPSSTIRTATQILGRMIFTILTDKGRFFLSDGNFLLSNHIFSYRLHQCPVDPNPPVRTPSASSPSAIKKGAKTACTIRSPTSRTTS